MSFSLSPIARMATGLAALALSAVLALDFLTGAMDGEVAHAQALRRALSEQISVQLTGLLARGDNELLRLNVNEFVARNASVRSIAVRPADQPIIIQAGDHDKHWQVPLDGKSTLDHVLVPIKLRGSQWGAVEISYKSLSHNGWRDWVNDSRIQFFVGCGLSLLMMFYLYLRKALRYLDPSKAVPQRVNTAFDSLTEAVLIIDRASRIMLANNAFKALCPHHAETLIGKTIGELNWLASGLGDVADAPPWTQAMKQREPVRGTVLEIILPDGDLHKLTVNAAPILDDRKNLKGCMISFDDVTLLEERNFELLQAAEQLSIARAQLEEQNKALEFTASRDALTGCLNRRAFFERAEALEQAAQRAGTPLTAIMIDVDHFKQINDRYGHANGDRVLQQVAKVMLGELRGEDLLGRYGGEEFAVVAPGLDVAEARRMVERLRAAIESKTGMGMRKMPWLVVTASLGFACDQGAAVTVTALLEQADKAMYEAKRTGRNRVVYYEPETGHTILIDTLDE